MPSPNPPQQHRAKDPDTSQETSALAGCFSLYARTFPKASSGTAMPALRGYPPSPDKSGFRLDAYNNISHLFFNLPTNSPPVKFAAAFHISSACSAADVMPVPKNLLHQTWLTPFWNYFTSFYMEKPRINSIFSHLVIFITKFIKKRQYSYALSFCLSHI